MAGSSLRATATSGASATNQITHDYRTALGSGRESGAMSRLTATAAQVETDFPVTLHQLLNHGDQRIMRWQTNGKSFSILNGDALERQVLPTLCPYATIETFGRLLGLYGFQRIEQGPFTGDYHHSLFQRDRPDLAFQMKKVGQSTSSAQCTVGSYMQGLAFPAKLHYLLSSGIYDLCLEHVMSWQSDGVSFVIRSSEEFENRGLAELCNAPGYASFRAELLQHGFQAGHLSTAGIYAETFRHPDFVRDNPKRCDRIMRNGIRPDSSSDNVTSASTNGGCRQISLPTKIALSSAVARNGAPAPRRSTKPRKRCRLAGEPMPKNYFPFKLHAVITLCEKFGYQHVVSWQSHGRCFVIPSQELFIEHVLPLFRHSEYASFRAQLKAYGFNRLGKSGPDKGGYYNDFFLRSRPELCAQIIRRPKNQHGTVRGRPKGGAGESEPDFYAMIPMPKNRHKVAKKPIEGDLLEMLKEALKDISPPPVSGLPVPPPKATKRATPLAKKSELSAGPPTGSFASKLHSLLSHAEKHGLHNIVQWEKDGRAFSVLDEEAFEAGLCPRWLNISSFDDFREELKLYGFSEEWQNRLGYYQWSHELFIQALPHLCASISRSDESSRPNGNGKRPPDADAFVANEMFSKSQRTPSFDSPRSSATQLTGEMGSSELEVAMALTTFKTPKEAGSDAPEIAPSRKMSSCAEESVAKSKTKKQEDPPGRRYSIHG